jgi:hypothetical protein
LNRALGPYGDAENCLSRPECSCSLCGVRGRNDRRRGAEEHRFAEFRGKRFTLLWRGGFGARDFHGRCDIHAPTLTLIQDTVGNIFGRFTPVESESPSPWDVHSKADPSVKTFLYTLKNPRNFSPRKCPVKRGPAGRQSLVISRLLQTFVAFVLPITVTQAAPIAVPRRFACRPCG